MHSNRMMRALGHIYFSWTPDSGGRAAEGGRCRRESGRREEYISCSLEWMAVNVGRSAASLCQQSVTSFLYAGGRSAGMCGRAPLNTWYSTCARQPCR
jgi:hypothetical protein